ncbi:LacI family transcriptional regulator (plasmid) [Ensifer adhaerens]|jgi:LacI family repressor for deo operon, udp, cdd, tsx, nupC, and nupG|uniref:LacI family DNA-binding transcriptional regulator n=1 Tax=Ensifer adhaerens TaxID=106592 RepID=A0A9Q8YDW9_ENSAD|nr:MULTISPECIES: LacI family DNA-binding transcriptional regulator [Ensifer]KSV80086.1 LacI family transcriptional regulator [Sinorhizobium sp. GL2]OWZ95356.1 LacI family transcriptional regulator [Sinorhizobium sp. LM21]ANK76108.1 LacI family transcriptional regulator [Ensifer adhaerens]KDP70504.1 LacI family transcriptional regulator [Ensifer adhaerens]MBD9523108.1 LacI family DNA-binding transcriptional regulator [Ensifer sp. ENS02]
MSERPKIKDIAERAGVSVATVSRALSGSSLVTDETRQRINALARELNYRPNVSARNLRTRRSMSVLLVVRDVGNPFYLEILKGVEATAREAGYAVLMGNTENDPDREVEYFNMLRDGHADGMILMTGKLPPPEPGESADLSHLPVVIALEMIEGSGFPHVQIDNVAAAEAAVDHLIALGHRRIAHIAGPLPEVMALHRRDGYRAAMKAAGLAVPEGYEVRGDYLLESGEACASDLFALPEPPTAIFAANDEMAYGAIHALRRLGREVPGDVSVVGFDDLYLSKAFYPPLTTVSQPRADIGRTAMSQLLNVLSDGDVAAEPAIVLPTTLNIRGSTAPPRK